MKYLLIVLIAFLGCKEAKVKKQHDPIVVGKIYKICCCIFPEQIEYMDAKTAFYSLSEAVVVVTAIKNGVVQYRWAHDIEDPTMFYRTIKDFNDLIDMCVAAKIHNTYGG